MLRHREAEGRVGRVGEGEGERHYAVTYHIVVTLFSSPLDLSPYMSEAKRSTDESLPSSFSEGSPPDVAQEEGQWRLLLLGIFTTYPPPTRISTDRLIFIINKRISLFDGQLLISE